MKGLFQRSWNNMKWILKGVASSKKWILAYIIIILIPASIMLYSYYKNSSSILEEEVTHSMLQTMKQAGNTLYYQFVSLQDTSDSIFMNNNVYKLLNPLDNQASIGDQLDALKGLRSLITAQTNRNVFQVRFFVDKNKLFADEHVNFFPLDRLKNRNWYKQVVEANGSIVWIGSYLEHYIEPDEDKYVLSAARMLHNPLDYESQSGILLIDYDEQNVADILAKIELTKLSNVYIVDSEGTFISHKNKSLIGTKLAAENVLEAISKSKEDVAKITEGNGTKYVVYTTIPSTGWKLVADVPSSEISRNAIKLNQFSGVAILLGVTVLFLLLVFMLLGFLVKGMSRRMQLVTRAIQQEGVDHLGDPIISGYGDYNLLERSVDRLIHRVKNLMEETYRSKVQEREAQLRALQAQINPHFLYNTLDTINWIAIGRNAHDISQMIDGLAKYFRLSLNKGRDVVSVTDELNLAKVYLEIQQNRFPHSFEFQIESDPALHVFIMPKLTLQPIVENALLHGIRKSKGKDGSIRIIAQQRGEDLILSVTDDGIGMEQEAANELLNSPRPTMRADGSGSSYGLYNVDERIKLFSGETYGLRIHSQPGIGTTVTVTLKAIKEATRE
jgi:two-component system sensor histidine kinase YesM